MTDNVKELINKARNLRTLGNTYAQIGKQLGITRQYAEVLVHYEKYHDEEFKEKHKKYIKKDKQKEYAKKWRFEHPEYFKLYQRKWYQSFRRLVVQGI